VRNHAAGAEEIQCGGNIVAALVPEIREAEKSEVREIDSDKEEREEHPEGDVAGSRFALIRRCAHALIMNGQHLIV
jgi:hypothetical protein